MAKRDKTFLYDIDRLNAIFAICSIVLLVVVIWMIADDYSREWKDWQRKFNRLEVEKTQAAIEEVDSELDQGKLEQLEADIQAARSEMDENEENIERAKEGLSDIDARWYAADQNYRFTKAELDAAKYEYEELLREESEAKAQHAKEKLDELQGRLASYKLEVEAIETERKAAQTNIDELEGNVNDLQAKSNNLLGAKNRLEKKLSSIKPGFVNYVRNLPILDFMNPSLKIQQVVLKDLSDDINFAKVPKVDRCTTCHLAIDREGYEDAPQPFTTHPNLDLYLSAESSHPVEDFGCTVCHQGRGRGTTFATTAHTPHDEIQKKEWETKYGWEKMKYWEHPMLAKETVEAGCNKCHEQSVDISGADQLNTGKRLYEVSGCWGCHKTDGFENLRKVGPDLAHIASKTNEDWAYHWIENPSRIRPTTRMPRFFGLQNWSEYRDREVVIINSIVDYLFDVSEPIEYETVSQEDSDVEAGRKIVESVGCQGCHIVGSAEAVGLRGTLSNFGPNLNDLASKTSKEWLVNWLKRPNSYFAETRMPDLRLSDKEALDVAAYLLNMNDGNGNPVNLKRPESDPDLLNEVALEALRTRMTKVDAESKLNGMSEKDKRVFVGERYIRMYGCFGCHNIPGFENAQPIGTELTVEGSKAVDRLDFGFIEMEKSLPAWFLQKLKEPRIFDRGRVKRPEEKLRMPNFHFTDEEAEALVTFLLSLTKEEVPLESTDMMTVEELDVEVGRRLVREKNCTGCHIIEGQGGGVRESIAGLLEKEGRPKSDAVALSPPDLSREGEKVQPDWLFRFLKQPTPIRPWLKVRMPTFHLTDTDAIILTRYFAGLSKHKFGYEFDGGEVVPESQAQVGSQVFTMLKCQSCHPTAGQDLTAVDVGSLAPDLSMAKNRLKPDWIVSWLKDPQGFQKGTKMPSNWPFIAGRYFVPPPLKDVLGGDVDKQVTAVRDYLLTLGD